MIVRGVRLVNFRAARDARLASVAERGVVEVAPETGADAGLVADALAFAFRGVPEDAVRVVAEGAGFAYVETALSVNGAPVSLFRGLDRRGGLQVSLRETDGPRITSGADAVRARLQDLLGAPLAVWEEATFLTGAASSADPFRAAPPAPAPPPAPLAVARTPPPPAPSADLAELRDRAERAVDGLRRAMRAEALKERVETDYAALCAFGARLRRERTVVSVEIDQAAAERDRVRARLRRVGEYRDLVAQQRAAAPPPAPPPRQAADEEPWAARGAAACAVALLLALVYFRTTPDLLPQRAIAVFLGLAFLGAAAAYVHFAAEADAAHSAARTPEPVRTPGEEARDALRHRFADLGDPDDPRLLDDLRARLAPLDAEIEPLQKRMEQVDEALAAFDVEAGRAARVTHGALSLPRDEAQAGLSAGETPAGAVARIGKLGDAVYHAAVERDALAAGGAASAAAAADAVRAAFRALGEAQGDAARADAALERAGLAAEGAAPARRDADLCVRLSEEAAALGRRQPQRAALPAAAPPPAAPEKPRPDVAALLGDVVERLTGRSFVLVQDGPRLELRLQGAGEAKPVAWSGLSLAARERVALALTLRTAEAALGGDPDDARFVVLDERPSAIGDDAAIAEVVRIAAPRVAQVFVPPAAADAFAPGAGTAAGVRVTPR